VRKEKITLRSGRAQRGHSAGSPSGVGLPQRSRGNALGLAYSRRSTEPIRIQYTQLSQKTVSAVTRRELGGSVCRDAARRCTTTLTGRERAYHDRHADALLVLDSRSLRPKYAACRCLLGTSAGSSPNPSRPRVGPSCAPLARLRTTCWPFLPIAANCANAGGTPQS